MSIRRAFRALSAFALAALALAALTPGQPAQAAQEAKIGCAFSMTGAAAAYGATQKNGASLAMEQINAAGQGPKLTLLFEDDASVPQQGINVYNKFINADKVSLIIGPTLSGTAQVVDRIAQQAKVPVLAISNTAPGITAIGDYIFRDSLTEGVVIPNTIKAVKDKLGIKKVVLLYGNDDAYTKGGYMAFKPALTQAGIEIMGELTFAKGDRDFAPQLTQIKGMNPDAIICSALVEEASGIVAQARQLGITAPIVGGNGFNSPALIKNAGDSAEGVIVGAAWNASSPLAINQKFVADYTQKFGSPPDQFAAQAFAGVHIAYAAISKAGEPANHAAIRQALTEIKDLPTVLGPFFFTPDRDAGSQPVVQVVKGGKFAIFGQ